MKFLVVHGVLGNIEYGSGYGAWRPPPKSIGLHECRARHPHRGLPDNQKRHDPKKFEVKLAFSNMYQAWVSLMSFPPAVGRSVFNETR
jgi:hypothetical protein